MAKDHIESEIKFIRYKGVPYVELNLLIKALQAAGHDQVAAEIALSYASAER